MKTKHGFIQDLGTVAPTAVDSGRDQVSLITGARASTGLDWCGIPADRSRRLTA